VIQDDTFQRLQSFPNVVITAHQSFFRCLRALKTLDFHRVVQILAG
ncbi:MAG: 2-hydroxyacid dehydrogenase, partial [Cyanobacteria bacterium J06607_13]